MVRRRSPFSRPQRRARLETLEPRTLFAAPNITGIDTGGDAVWNEGEYVFIGGSFTDSDANDRRTVVVNWGDGSPAHVETLNAGVRGFTTNRHAYPDDDTSVLGQPRRYTITVTVTDSTNQSDTETRQITVNNVAPSVRLPEDWVPALEGAPVTIPGNVYDPGLSDTHTFAWRVTRGSFPDVQTVFEGTARDLVFTPPDNGTYDVSLEVRDDDGGARTAAARIWATNAPPVLTVRGAAASGEGQPYELELRSTDAGADAIQSWTIDWGDGRVETIAGNPTAATHRYDGPGHYTLRASATDEDGTWGAAPLGVAHRAGDVDRSFAPPTGRAVTDFPLPVTSFGNDTLVYPADARLLVLRTTNGSNAVEGLSLSRFNPDGSFDGTFDGDGRLFFPGRWNVGQTLALQPDGKILFAAVRGMYQAESFLDVFRLHPDGSPDATFGAGGVATVPIGVQHEGTIRSVDDLLLLPDGRIVVPTGSVGLFTSRLQAVRLNPDGSPDSTFGTGGRVEIDPPIGLKTVSASQALLAPDGQVVLVGSGSAASGTIPSTAYYGVVAALAPDGSLDTSFGSSGWLTRPFGTTGFRGSDATFLPDGDLVVAYGSSSAASAWDLVRYNLGGAPNAFGPDGVADPAFAWGHVYSVEAAPGGKILVAGTFDPSGNSGGIAVARYNADGTLDSTFANGGRLTPIGSVNSGAVTVHAVPDGRVVVAGTYDGWMFATRHNANGSYDTGFGNSGRIQYNRFAPHNFVGAYVRSLHVLPDKKILAVGPESGQREFLYLARYLPDGTPDLSFGEFGRVVNFVGLGGSITGVLVDASGKVWVARGGQVHRFNPDGSPDAAFNDQHLTFSPARHFALAPDGKIVGTGIRDTSLVVLRFNPDGTPDATFGDAGRFEGFPDFVYSPFGYEEVKAVTVQADGRIVVGGRGLVRLTAAGQPDPTFGGGDGFVPAAPFVPPGWEEYGHQNFVAARGVAVAPDGRILTAWGGNQDMSHGGYAVARYLPDGTLDPSFAGDGQALYGNGIAERVALDPRGRILVGGFGTDADAFATRGGGYAALRLLPDGTRDLSFGRDGVVAVPTPGTGVGETFVNQMAVLDTGDVLLGGIAPGGGFLLSRFRADDERSQTVDVWNTPPAANAGPDREAYPGTPITLTGTFTDPSPSDTHTFQWVVTAAGGTVVAQGTGTSITFTPQWNGRYTASFIVTDDDGAYSSDSAFVDAAPRVVGRHVFYNNSVFDGRNPNANPSDDAAIATDKQALLPGAGPGGFANLTGYTRGINGIMFDIAGNLPMTALAGIAGGADLTIGTGGDPATWSEVPVQPQIGIRAGAGVNGSDRVTLTWPDGVIRNTWLRVRLHAPPQVGLGFPDDVFYFGNLVGDTAGTSAAPRVDGTDHRLTRLGLTANAAVTNPRDHNRDGRVNVLDGLMVRASQGHALGAITNAVAPAFVPASAPARRRSTVRGALDLSSRDPSV